MKHRDCSNASTPLITLHPMSHLFQSEQHLIELARANPTWFQKAYDAVRRFFARLAGKRPTDTNLKKLERLFAKAAKAANTASQTQKSPANVSGVRYSFKGVHDDGRPIYESNFPKGTPKAAKSERILEYIQKVWSKKPIRLVITNGESSRVIEAQFDPTIDEKGIAPSDASKIAGGNRHGNHTEQRVTLDLADDYYEIARNATYNYSKMETGKDSVTHSDVIMWHYFVNDIYFAEYGESELTPYTVTINVKEKADGEYVYSFNAEKESSTRRTLHADVNATKGINGELFFNDIIPGSSEKSNPQFSLPSQSALQTPSYLELTPEQRLERDTKEASRLLERKHVVDNAPPDVAPVLENIMNALDEMRVNMPVNAQPTPTEILQTPSSAVKLDANIHSQQSADTSVSTDQSAVGALHEAPAKESASLDPTDAELNEAFKAGAEGRRYVPKKTISGVDTANDKSPSLNIDSSQPISTPFEVDNIEREGYNEKEKSRVVRRLSKKNLEDRIAQLLKNSIQGRDFEKRMFLKLNQIADECVEQITIVTAKGTRIRVDAMAIDRKTKRIIIQEYKSSKTAPLTKNQKKGFSELKELGGIIVGKGKGEVFRGGKPIPPNTDVEIIRPD